MEESDDNDSVCFICKTEGGELVCCDNCRNACHIVCLGKSIESLPDVWHCPSCSTKGDVPYFCLSCDKGGVLCAPPLMPNEAESEEKAPKKAKGDGIVLVEHMDILIQPNPKNQGNHYEYSVIGGNAWLNQLVDDNVKEYFNIVGKHNRLRRHIFLTTIINQLTNENQRVLQMRNGEWAQLTEPAVRVHIQQRMSNVKKIKQIMIPVVDVSVIESRTKAIWKDSEEKDLRDWYSNMEVDISQMHSEDFSGIAKEIGRSVTACLVHLKKMLRNGLSKEEMERLINNWSKPEIDCDANIPTEYTLPQLCDMEGMTNNFSKNLNNNRVAIHIMQIPPNKLATFDKDVYLKTNKPIWMTMNKIT
jgi:hypothetical protein